MSHYAPRTRRQERVEQAIARTGSLDAACQLLPDIPARVIAAVWGEMQDAVYPTDIPAKPGPKPKSQETAWPIRPPSSS